MEKIITDNASEKIIIKWDGERFAIIAIKKSKGGVIITVLNPKEMLDI